MQAKKACWERARRDGADRKVNQLLSAAYLLVSEAYVLYSEAESELRRYGLLLGQTKHLLGAVERTMNRYFDQFKGAVKPQERANYFEDLDAFDREFRRWARLGGADPTGADGAPTPPDSGELEEKGGTTRSISAVWHTHIKEAQTQRKILVEFTSGRIGMFDDMRLLRGIEDLVERYAYVDDLLPEEEKGGTR